MNSWPLLSVLTFLPLLGALLLAVFPLPTRSVVRGFALAALALTGVLMARFDLGTAGLQFVEKAPWIPSLGVDYFVGVDGLSLLLVLLTALLLPLAWEVAGPERTSERSFGALFLLLQSALFGTFTALNFIHWFLYWELGLIPAYFLIKLWGHDDRRGAATQFFVYTFGGSIAMLVAMQAVYLTAGTFDLIQLRDLAATGELARRLPERLTGWGPELRLLLFLGVFIGLAVKVPLFPFHGWLAPTYSSAPPSVTVLLTGAMSKMGVYGFVRILLPLFPQETRTLLGPLVALAVISLVFAAFAALAQTNLRRMLAYSSMNHLGYAVLGLLVAMDPAARANPGASPAVTALAGAVLQLFNHGVTAGALFACVALLERRLPPGSNLEHLGGLRAVAPVFAGLMGLSVFASLGLPGLNGFISEFLIFAGVFPLAPAAALLSLPGLLVSAWFLLNLMQRVFLGPATPACRGFADLNVREIATLAPALGIMLLLGVFPQAALMFLNPTIQGYLTRMAP